MYTWFVPKAPHSSLLVCKSFAVTAISEENIWARIIRIMLLFLCQNVARVLSGPTVVVFIALVSFVLHWLSACLGGAGSSGRRHQGGSLWKRTSADRVADCRDRCGKTVKSSGVVRGAGLLIRPIETVSLSCEALVRSLVMKALKMKEAFDAEIEVFREEKMSSCSQYCLSPSQCMGSSGGLRFGFGWSQGPARGTVPHVVR